MNKDSQQQTQEYDTKSASERLDGLNKLSPRDIELQNERARIETPKVLKDKEAIKTPVQHPKRTNNKTIDAKRLDESYNKIMDRVQSELPSSSRLFSKIIHYKSIELISNTIGSTIARPNAILFGAIFAFTVSLSLYIIAKTIGYSLSGSETIVTFAIGWVIGLAYDLVGLLFNKNKI